VELAVIVYKGDEIWTIPLTHERTFQFPRSADVSADQRRRGRR